MPHVPEAYQSLYRRFRPQRFGELRGQERVAEALRRAVASGQVSHAYLFSGPRGTGKTSTARILAKALNCEAPIDGEPCLVCSSCIAVANGASADVEELDAASNSGVDSMRWITQTVQAAPVGRWRVYIIDEVHMLTQAASNALLKTLEEPPAHVVFILATTNPSKVLPTVRSRTQHFAFRLLDDAVIDALIDDVACAVGSSLDEEAKAYVRRRGGGSARDTLSVLEQVLALGGVPSDGGQGAAALAEAIEARDLARAVDVVSEAFAAGVEASELLADTVGRLADRFVELARQGARGAELARYSRPLEALGRLGASLRDALDPSVVVLAGIAEAIAPDERIAALEREVRSLAERLAALERGALVVGVPTAGAAGTLSAALTETAEEPRVRAAPVGSPTPSTEARVPPPEPSALARIRRGRSGAGAGPQRTVSVADEPARGEPPAEAPRAAAEPEVAVPALGVEERRRRLQADWYDRVIERAPRDLRALLEQVRVGVRDGAIVLLCDQRPVGERLAPRLGEVSALLDTALLDGPLTLVVESAPAETAPTPSPASDRSEELDGEDIAEDVAEEAAAAPAVDLSEPVIETNLRSVFGEVRRLR